jgi:hypothetical protein
MNSGKATRNARRSINGSSSSSVSTSITVVTNDAGIHLNAEYNDDNIFYAAATNAFDHSQTVRQYYHDNRSRIYPKNKSLWPLRYRAYKETVIWEKATTTEQKLARPSRLYKD